MQVSDKALFIHSRIASLEVGMYLFRLVADAAYDAATKTFLSLNQSPIGKGAVDFFPGEGISRNTLSKPGDCVVVRVKGGSAGVLITEYKPERDTRPVQLRIDRIEASPKIEGTQKPSSPAPRENNVMLKLLGHIERRGDVSVTDDWLGDPTSTARIEGFSIDWAGNKPEGVELAYLCRVAKGSEPLIAITGQYVGTRRQAKPLTAVAFALTGTKAADYELSGQAVFAGQAPMAIAPDKELSGPTATEQLVALRVIVKHKAAQVSPPASPWDDAATTQIFRSH
ncbi:hypothetical protein SSTU70S_06548 [Stutzerimonas stutzeri]